MEIESRLKKDAIVTSTPEQRVREQSLLHYIGVSLSAALLVLIAALAVLVIVMPKIAGGIPLTVLTSSMVPRYPPGTLLVDLPVEPDSLRLGDVATYQIDSGKPGVITHRIIAIESSSDGSRTFQFKGDNNSQPDERTVVEKQVQGKVWYSLPFIGYVNNAVNGSNKIWIVPVLAMMLFAYAGYSFISGIVASRRKSPSPLTHAVTGSIPVDILISKQSTRRPRHLR